MNTKTKISNSNKTPPISINCAFWNIKDKSNPFDSVLASFVKYNKINFLILSENDNISDTEIRNATNLERIQFTKRTSKAKPWLYLYCSKDLIPFIKTHDTVDFKKDDVVDKDPRETEYFAKYLNKFERIVFLSIENNGEKLLVVPIHFPSKVFLSEKKQYLLAKRYKSIITEFAVNNDFSKTIIVGDFNMNPFEDGLIGIDCFHAISSREIAKQPHSFYSIPIECYYNPTWALHGDFKYQTKVEKPAGTYYLERAENIDYYWSLFDQVIMSPNAIPHFNEGSLQLIHEWGAGVKRINLLKDGVPNKSLYSDHLPLIFKLKI